MPWPGHTLPSAECRDENGTDGYARRSGSLIVSARGFNSPRLHFVGSTRLADSFRKPLFVFESRGSGRIAEAWRGG
jgi:hypothetical protein